MCSAAVADVGFLKRAGADGVNLLFGQFCPKTNKTEQEGTHISCVLLNLPLRRTIGKSED